MIHIRVDTSERRTYHVDRTFIVTLFRGNLISSFHQFNKEYTDVVITIRSNGNVGRNVNINFSIVYRVIRLRNSIGAFPIEDKFQ